MMYGNERQQSEYNMAFSYLNRLNNLFYTADESAISLNAHQWWHTLLTLFRELITELKEEEIELLNQNIPIINKQLEYHSRTFLRRGSSGIAPELYKLLHDFEIVLRQAMKKSGLLLKMREDPGFALK